MIVREVDPNRRIAKLLFVMGATWHNQCMFDVRAAEDSVADLLNAEGIESYTFNHLGTGPEEKTEPIGNGHQQNIDHAITIIKEHNIDYLLCYSYGCHLIFDILKKVSVKGVILFDPVTNNPLIHKKHIGDGKFQIEKSVIKEYVSETINSPMSDAMLTAYLDNLCNDQTLTTAEYTYLEIAKSRSTFLGSLAQINHVPMMYVCSRNVPEKVKNFLQQRVGHRYCYYPTATHFLFLENERVNFVKDLVNFVTNKV